MFSDNWFDWLDTIYLTNRDVTEFKEFLAKRSGENPHDTLEQKIGTK